MRAWIDRKKDKAFASIRRERSPVPDASNVPGEASVPISHSLDTSIQGSETTVEKHGGEQLEQAVNLHFENQIQTHPKPVSRTSFDGQTTDETLRAENKHLAPEQDLWGQAFQSLTEKEKAGLTALVNSDESTSETAPATASIIPDLIAATKTRQEECEQRFWRISIGKSTGSEIILREQAAQIITWLTVAGDIGVQFAPSLVAHIWPGIKALLRIAVKESEQMAAVLQVADRVARVVARGRVYEACFNTRNTPSDALEILYAALIAVYTASLSLLATASGLLDANLFQRTVHSIMHPNAVKDEDGALLSDQERRLARDVQAVESARFAGIAEDLLLRLRNLDTPIARIDEKVAQVLESVEAEEEYRILDSVSPVLYSSHHDSIAESRMRGTCGWILQHPKFQEWESSSGCALMWLRGFTGTGKTFLSSKVVNHARNILDSGSNHEAIAFFYFNRNDATRNSALACLTSLVRQLSTCRSRRGYMQPTLRKLYKECRRDGSTLSQKLCLTQLTESLNLFPRSTVIIDALDECRKTDRQELVHILNNLMKVSRRPLKIFISGRPDGDIKDAFSGRATVEIGVEDNQEDIVKFIEDKVQNHRRWDRFKPDTRKRVVSTLIEKSQGMFRWTALQIDELLKLRLEDDVNDRLGKLPPDLKTVYDHIYQTQISDRGMIESSIAERAIMWVLVAFEPLGLTHLLSLIRVDAGRYNDVFCQPGTNMHGQRNPPGTVSNGCLNQEVDQKMLLELCANLLTLDSRTQKWAFAHASVAEYFEEHHFSLLHAHAYVGFITLMVLIDVAQPDLAQRPLGELVRREPNQCLVDYACGEWGNHLAVVDKALTTTIQAGLGQRRFETDTLLITEGLRVLLRRFLGHPYNSSPEYRSWREKFSRSINKHTFRFHLIVADMFGDLTERYAGLAVVHYGLVHLLPEWWHRPAQVHNEGNDLRGESCQSVIIDTTILSRKGWNLLDFACFFGRTPLAVSLLEMNMTGPGHVLSTNMALYIAADRKHADIVRHLLCAGADVNFRVNGQEYRYSIYTASSPWSKHRKVRKSRYDDTYNKDEETVLMSLAWYNNAEMLRVIVEESRAGPRTHPPGIQEGLSYAALTAAYYLRTDTLRYLVLDAHVDPNARHLHGTSFYTTILSAAASWLPLWDSKVIRCLEECGVDFELPEGDLCRLVMMYQTSARGCQASGSLLETAVISGQVEVVRFALRHWTADVNAFRDHGPYGSALIRAAYYGKCDVLQYLLDEGADANLQVPGGRYHCALVAAVRRFGQKESTLDTLIRNGADINLPLEYGKFGSVLAAVAAEGSKSVL